ncbi:GTPase-associated system all-helical protein GASH [Paraburkholderia rhizosphaerae]|uniref:GTPase-associated system helical domain-containing protein n=1 Tax=Paraburkholderia rhizosphaerae TaxID=480658 RepID=A0A4R8LPT0_9BURK|nr:GTPase-associated system all-helical protein GASH [Paraburkholderia rhizosphaerae]TDY48246.1 hypothetical protein BX592_111181 [Paraburkholderia rhizosphaerae]
MAASVKPMHQDFARWYSSVSMGDDAQRRQNRWQGVLSVVSGAGRDIVEALLRLAYDTRAEPDASVLQAIRQDFKNADDAFEMSGNKRELQVLSGSCLAILMEDQDEYEGAAAALAITTAALGGARSHDLPMDLLALAEAAIVQRASKNRTRPRLSDVVTRAVPKFDFEQAKAKIREQQSWDGVVEAFSLAAEATSATMKNLAARQVSSINAAENFIQIQDEELQMLWWITGQRSEEYAAAFDAVPAEVQPLVFASDLANDTALLPGPPSVKALLSRAGLKERKKIAVVTAVNAPKQDWMRRLMDGTDLSPVSTPLHFAIQRQLETGAGDAWVPGWAAVTGIDAGHTLPALTLGELFYRERLLLLFE